jgi:hypothetical protein
LNFFFLFDSLFSTIRVVYFCMFLAEEERRKKFKFSSNTSETYFIQQKNLHYFSFKFKVCCVVFVGFSCVFSYVSYHFRFLFCLLCCHGLSTRIMIMVYFNAHKSCFQSKIFCRGTQKTTTKQKNINIRLFQLFFLSLYCVTGMPVLNF